MKLAIATCRELPTLGEDADVLREACRRHGIDAEPAIWDEPRDWTVYDAVLLRTVWDYTDNLPAFLAWARAVPRLVNSLDLVEWNTDKRYLGDLAARGIPTVPTTYLTPGERLTSMPGDFVVKPTVSAGGKNSGRFIDGDPGAADLVALIHSEGKTAMIQPYLTDVDEHGETALVYLGGEFSHALRKTPFLADGGRVQTVDLNDVGSFVEPRQPRADELDLGRRVLAALPEMPAYARVDLLPSPDGPVLLELELVEPALWLVDHPGSADKLLDAVLAHLAAV